MGMSGNGAGPGSAPAPAAASGARRVMVRDGASHALLDDVAKQIIEQLLRLLRRHLHHARIILLLR